MFDEKTKQQLQYYVYVLIDPIDEKPFYVGKGINNRVFDHSSLALTDIDVANAKYEKIREINEKGFSVVHMIIRHGLTEKEAFEVEASLIDTLDFCKILLANKAGGHDSAERGLMNSDEIVRLYNAEPLTQLDAGFILVNINKKYKRGKGQSSIYNATKETWTIQKSKVANIKYVLSEYRGLVVEVFKVNRWYEKERGYTPMAKQYGQTKIGYAFDGEIAEDEVRRKYINKSIAHIKKKGAASVVRYNI